MLTMVRREYGVSSSSSSQGGESQQQGGEDDDPRLAKRERRHQRKCKNLLKVGARACLSWSAVAGPWRSCFECLLSLFKKCVAKPVSS